MTPVAGQALVGLLLAESGFDNLEGLDLSPGMLDEAWKKGCYQVLHRQQLGGTLHFASGTFDAVLVVGVFVRAHAPSTSLHELVRITKPGGFVVFTLRPEFRVDSDFHTTMEQLTAANRWRLAESTDPFDGRYKEFPGINLQVWAYEVTSNE